MKIGIWMKLDQPTDRRTLIHDKKNFSLEISAEKLIAL